MAKENIDQIKQGLMDALAGTRAEIDKHFSQARASVEELAQQVGSDKDVKKVVSGTKALMRRLGRKITKTFQETPKASKKPSGRTKRQSGT